MGSPLPQAWLGIRPATTPARNVTRMSSLPKWITTTIPGPCAILRQSLGNLGASPAAPTMLGDCTFQDLRQASPLSGERSVSLSSLRPLRFFIPDSLLRDQDAQAFDNPYPSTDREALRRPASERFVQIQGVGSAVASLPVLANVRLLAAHGPTYHGCRERANGQYGPDLAADCCHG